MASALHIFIGGSDRQNGDYSRILRAAGTRSTMRWSSIKGARPGDRVLIYVQRPQSALVASAVVLGVPTKGRPGDYAYRAKIGQFSLLPNRLSIRELKRAFPKWAWLRFPRGKATVPSVYAERLWNLIHERAPAVQILIANAAFGLECLEKQASSGAARKWSAPKRTRKGDSILFYVEKPVSAIVAIGTALADARPTASKWWEAKVGAVRLLSNPIELADLREMFPDWAWLRSVNMFAYPTDRQAELLRRRVATERSSRRVVRSPSRGGAGFGDPATNRLVEKAAVAKVTRELVRSGFSVYSRESEGVGYDLEATKGRRMLHVEVKGISGTRLQFPITANELHKARTDSAFRLYAVLQARTRGARIRSFTGTDLRRLFDVTPLAFMANWSER